MDNITFRAVYLERLTWSDSMDQTIASTQVAGFSQLFNLDDGDEIKLFGFGVDAELSGSISVGADFTRKDIEIYWKMGDGNDFYESIDQALYHACIHWTPADRLGVRIAYEQNDFSSSWQIKNLKTKRIPLGLSYHWRSGMFLQAEGVYIKQEIARSANDVARDDFWNIDVVVGYRLPKRYGKFELIAKNRPGRNV